MKKFQQNVARELKRAYPDRRKLECQVKMGFYLFTQRTFYVTRCFLPLESSEIPIFLSLFGLKRRAKPLKLSDTDVLKQIFTVALID